MRKSNDTELIDAIQDVIADVIGILSNRGRAMTNNEIEAIHRLTTAYKWFGDSRKAIDTSDNTPSN